jgi:putative SOS response-associated peptidase YedK
VCGRFALTAPAPVLRRVFPGLELGVELDPRYNLAPGQDVLVIERDGDRLRGRMRHWGVDVAMGRGMIRHGLINVRVETAGLRHGFAELVARSRVLVPASHFYEWRRLGRRRQPVAVLPRTQLVCFAALLGHWHDPAGDADLPGVVILTCGPNADVAALHDRMPAVLGPAAWARWLSPETGVDEALDLLHPAPDGTFTTRTLCSLVNDVRNEGPEVMEEGPEELWLPGIG